MAAVAVATGVFLLALVNLERAIQGVFASSLASLGVNLSLLSVPLLLTGFLYPLGLKRAWPHKRGFLSVCLVLAIAFTVATLIGHATVAILSAAAATAFLTPWVVFLGGAHPLATVSGLAAGTALNVAMRAINGTAALTSTATGQVMLLAVIIGVVAGWSRLGRTTGEDKDRPRLGLLGPAAFFAFLFIEYQLAGSPSALATSHGPGVTGRYLLLALGLHAGLAAGVLIALFGGPLKTRALRIGVPVAFAVSTGGLLLGWASPLAPLWVLVTQLTAVVLAKECLTTEPTSNVARAGGLAGLVQLLWLFFLIFHTFAPRWPFLPQVLWPILDGQATLYLVLSYALLPALFVTSLRKRVVA